MKKRRPCASNLYHSPKNSPRTVHVRDIESFSIKTKSFHDLKRRRLQYRSPKTKNAEYNDDSVSLKRDAFSSLESLFNVKKPLILPDAHSFDYHREGYVVPPYESASPRSPKTLVKSQHLKETTDLELGVLKEAYNVSEEKVAEETAMAENEEAPATEGEPDNLQNEEGEPEIVDEPPAETPAGEQATEGAREEEERAVSDKEFASITEESPEGGGDEIQTLPPQYPLPPGVGEGVPIKPGGRRESTLSSSPLTDLATVNKIRETDERCAVIANEIKQLKAEIAEITNKKDLTEEDTKIIKQKHDDVMAKLAESEQMTRNIQRLLGLTDPGIQSFAKMFDMLPYPHTPDAAILEESEELGYQKDKSEGGDQKRGVVDHFDLPQVEYPEDKLPRVIVCGYTEDEIPKIVVADSERKGKKRCLQNLTGKLTESLTMQERLVKENAVLEGGKYKLEEALLEKDSAVESLQRKVCGLQAEMRIVVKENTELTRQIASLNQRVTSPICCYTCPGGSSTAPSSPTALRKYSYNNSLQQDDDYCRCKCCLQQQFPDSFPPLGNTTCVSADGYKSDRSCDSPRLAGGASRTGIGSLISGTSSQSEDMCCRNPATTKPPCPGVPCAPPPPRGTCPAELENKLALYGNETKHLEQQLGSMECEVRNMQMELANVQRERQQLEQQRKLLKCTGPCAPCACCPPPPPCGFPSTSVPACVPPAPPSAPPMPFPQMIQHSASATCTGPCVNAPMGTSTCPQQQLRDLREQYARLQDDYKNKLCEVSCLRTDAEKLKQETRDAKEDKENMEIKMIDAQERLKAYESNKDKFEGYKEQMVEQEQALIVAKKRFREAQDELEELRSLIQDQATQLEDYRNKYLQAQQQVEEQRRQLDLMEMDNARMNENVTLEIGRVKNQFQEKLAELAPLPDILKQTQVKLQDAQQLRLVAERNCEDLSRELLGCKDKIQTLQNQLDVIRNEHQVLQDEKGHGSGRFDELERKNGELRHENERMKNTLARFEEHEAQLQKRIDEKLHEITQLTAMLEQVREDSARQVARTKERCDTVRRTMQGQIAEMERQLAQCRATARAAQKDRDEIRQKMQGQINNLNEAFEQAQGRIRSLQGHVNYLKTSYSSIFKGQGESAGGVLPGDTPGTGFDSCDCNY